MPAMWTYDSHICTNEANERGLEERTYGALFADYTIDGPLGDLQIERGGATDSSEQQVSHCCPNNSAWNWIHKLQWVQVIPNCLLYAHRQRRCCAAPSGLNTHHASPMSPFASEWEVLHTWITCVAAKNVVGRTWNIFILWVSLYYSVWFRCV